MTRLGGSCTGRSHGSAIGCAYGLGSGLLTGIGVVLGAGTAGLPNGPGSLLLAVPAAVIPALAFGLVAGRAWRARHRPGRTVVKVRGRLRELGKSLLGRAALGLLISVMVGVVTTPLAGAAEGTVAGVGSGLATMVTTALADGLTVPADELTSPSPTAVLHTDRSVARVRGLVQGLGLALMIGLVTAVGFGPPTGLAVGAVAGVAGVLAGGFDSAWGLFLVARAWLAFSGRLPWDVTGFLEDAHRRSVLRQAGATDQFRHARLQDRMTPADSRASTHSDR